ncbi:MAG: glycosyltransferase, partial [Proteobacteria bacterium]|nr:glycosyltransferase [Pseudomonadota bacterium]
MRVLMFTQQFAAFRSGVGTYASALAGGLKARGHSVTVVAPEGELREGGEADGIAAPRLGRDPTPGGWLSLGRGFARVLTSHGSHVDVAPFTDAREAWGVRHAAVPVVGMVNDSYALD